jgi:hypothetical protein
MYSIVTSPSFYSNSINAIFDPDTGGYRFPQTSHMVPTTIMKNDLGQTDYRMQDRMINYYHAKLIDKWLYNSSKFEKLAKFFNLTHDKKTINVELINKRTNLNKEYKTLSSDDFKQIFRYIEVFIASQDFVAKVLRKYVIHANVSWYNLPYNSDNIKNLMVHALKKKILKLIKKVESK